MSESRPISVRSGFLSFITTVFASGAVNAARLSPMPLSGRDEPFGRVLSASLNCRLRLASTSAEVKVVPSWKVTPWRSLNV